MKATEIYGTLEWSRSQMSFHFSGPGDRRIIGWEPVAEGIASSVSAEFISFLNHNWRERSALDSSEVKEMFESWKLLHEGELNPNNK